MIKDPTHPPGPAFDQAGDAAEAARQKEIAALTELQRTAFEKLKDEQQAKQKELRETQERAQRQELAKRMRRHLIEDKTLELKPDAHRHKLKQPQELGRAVEDHLAGRETRVTREYHRQLATARDKAKADLARDQKQTREKMEAAHKRERDEFLKRARGQRSKDRSQAFQENARKITRRGMASPFAEAAKDASWHRAFDRAAKQEADRDHEPQRDPSNELDESR